MSRLKSKRGSLCLGFLLCFMISISSEQVRADSFFDTGKVYTIFGFTFCFPACPYVSAAVPYPRYAVVEEPMPR